MREKKARTWVLKQAPCARTCCIGNMFKYTYKLYRTGVDFTLKIDKNTFYFKNLQLKHMFVYSTEIVKVLNYLMTRIYFC